MEERHVVDALIINDKKEFLLQKKTLDYAKSPGRWTFFGGRIEDTEEPVSAIKRELKEELGIDVENVKLFKKDFYELEDIHGKKYYGIRYIFIVDFDHKISNISLSEGAGFSFFDSSELNSINLDPFSRKTLEEYLTKKIVFV